MADQPEDQREAILNAVQAALTGFGEQVKTEFTSVRESMAAEQQARDAVEAQVAAMETRLARSQQQSAVGLTDLQRRIDEAGDHASIEPDALATSIDAAIAGVTATTASSIVATEAQLQTRLEAAVQSLSVELNAGLAAIEARRVAAEQKAADELAAGLAAVEEQRVAAESKAADELAAGLAAVEEQRVAAESKAADELAAGLAAVEEQRVAAEQKAADELATGLTAGLAAGLVSVDERLAASVQSSSDELIAGLAAVDERRVAAEQKAADDLASRLAALDEEIEQAAGGVESSLAALNERSNATDQRLDEIVEQVEALKSTVAALGATVAEIDVDAIDELTERVSAAAGEAVILQIEAERFQKSVNETHDKLQLRLVEVETSIQEQAMDVETAVQLERLEEIERALIELDPAQFVRVDTTAASTSGHDAPISASSGETDGVVAGRADDSVSGNPAAPTAPA